ncbi:MAG: 30S ribosomal protein S12 methylthiotransferase RimO [Coriobacteriia bacterium]
MPEAPAIAFVTLGCPKNEVDSDRMAAAVTASSYRLVDDPAQADVVVLNTCSFIQAATEESIAEAFELAGAWKPLGKDRKLVVAGCMVSRYGADLAEAMPEADAFLPVADEGSLSAVIERLTGVAAATPAVASAPPRMPPGHTAYLKVSEGCDRCCTYCAIPAIRGPFVSSPIDVLLAEARFLVDNGAREIVLVGQDIASYGHDLTGGEDLASLVEQLDRIDGDFRIRLMYLQPDGVTGRLLGAVARASRVCHYMDIPLQHVSTDVLEAMGRTGSPEAHLRLLERVRLALPDVVLRTTVIAGFPGETEEHASELEDFLAEARFDYVGVFAYSAEEGTLAASLPGQLPDDVRQERAQRLREVADAVGFERAAALVGSVLRVLVEGEEEGETIGRTCGQAPEVDGMTVLEDTAPAGAFVNARIIDSVGYDLVGAVL